MDDQEPREPRFPHAEGWSNLDPIDKDDPPIPPLEFPTSGTLGDQAEEYVFFNHGALFTYAGMEVDPVREYALKSSCKLRFVVADKPFFRNVSAGKKEFEHWDYSMLAAPISHWEDLSMWLVEAGVLDRTRKAFYKAYYMTVETVDWKNVANQGVLTEWPMIKVALFGLDGNKSFIRVNEARVSDSMHDPPIPGLSVLPPNPAAVSFAESVFNESSTPYNPDPRRNGQKR